MAKKPVITNEDQIFEFAKAIYESADAAFMKERLEAIRSYVYAHKKEIKASTYDEVLDLLQEKMSMTHVVGIDVDLRETIAVLRP